MKNIKVALLIVSMFLVLIVTFLLVKKESSENYEIIYVNKDKKDHSVVPVSTTAKTTSSVKTTKTEKTEKTSAPKTTSVPQTTQTTTTSKVPEKIYININTADSSELLKLNGIGEKLSEAIIRYRTENGRFNNIEELMNVSGIGEKLFSKIRENIYVDDPVYPEVTTTVTSTAVPVTTTSTTTETAKATTLPPGTTQTTTSAPEETTTEEPPPALTLEDAAPININTADKELLCLLPHVDEDIAEKIIKLREDIHGFSHPYEIYYIGVLERQQVQDISEYAVVRDEEEEQTECVSD